jgi:hypothetical protein
LRRGKYGKRREHDHDSASEKALGGARNATPLAGEGTRSLLMTIIMPISKASR